MILAQWCYIDKVRSATRSQALKYIKLFIYENKQPYPQFVDGKPDIQQLLETFQSHVTKSSKKKKWVGFSF